MKDDTRYCKCHQCTGDSAGCPEHGWIQVEYAKKRYQEAKASYEKAKKES